MPEGIIDLGEAERTAERYVRGRVKNIKEIVIESAKLAAVGELAVYEVEGRMKIGGNVFSKAEEKLFKIQVSSQDGKVVGYSV
ncbi:hypothetical protein ACFLWO_01495 [Chloroflexota bacterium]